MERTGFAIYSPENGWWSGRTGEPLDDRFGESIADACIFGSEKAAWQFATAMSERQDGCGILVYQVYFVQRHLGRRW